MPIEPFRRAYVSMQPRGADLSQRRPPLGAPSQPVDLAAHPLVTADDVAHLLGVKRKRVYELARRPGDPLPSVRIGGAVRFVLEQVEAWVARQSPR